jgi:hypothetical protein
MILNAFSALDAFFCLLRLLLAGGVVVIAVHLLRAASAPNVKVWEDRSYLLMQTSLVLLGLNVISWPLLYAVLQSYVPQWKGVMCIYGVTQIGAGSMGASRFLPDLLASLQTIKPAIVFLGGGWMVTYLMHRQAHRLALLRPMLALVACFGALTVADAALEGTYLAIPKKEQSLDVGCCTVKDSAGEQAARWLPAGSDARWVPWAFFGHGGFMVAGLLGAVWSGAISRFSVVAALAALSLGSLPLGMLFLTETAAPAILNLPFHHCPYDLLTRAPESVVGIAAYVLGAFCVGWGCLASRLGRSQSPLAASTLAGRLFFLAAIGYVAALVVMSLELGLSA